MAASSTTGLEAPVAFKDADDGTVPVRPPTEYAAAVASLPVNYVGNGKLNFRCYQGVWLPEEWVPGIMAMQRSFAARPAGDVLLASVPKSGTTWLKALMFAIMARAACPPASPAHPLRRLNPHDCLPIVETLFSVGRGAVLDALPSPRFMCTHLPLSVLPPSFSQEGSSCKIVHIYRDPKDMVVSFWHFINRAQPSISLQEMFENVCEGTWAFGPFWDHILGYWRASNVEPSRVLFLSYEQMLQDPVDKVRKLAQFLGRPFSDIEEEAGVIEEIVELCSFENLKNLEANKNGSQGVFLKFSHDSYFRKGVVGDWVNHLTPEMAKRMDSISEEKFRGSGITFQ